MLGESAVVSDSLLFFFLFFVLFFGSARRV